MIAFRADKASTSQTIVSSAVYTLCTFPHLSCDLNSGFDTVNSVWTPPAGLVIFGGQIWIQANATGQCTAKVIKNGVKDISSAIGSWGAYPNTMPIPMGMAADVANGTDTYVLKVYATGNSPVIDGNPAHTWWSGVWLG